MFWRPAQEYAALNLQQLADEITKQQERTQKADRDIVIEERSIILRSPDGTYYKISVANGGALSTTSLGTSL